jgi:hypothetical protein
MCIEMQYGLLQAEALADELIESHVRQRVKPVGAGFGS